MYTYQLDSLCNALSAHPNTPEEARHQTESIFSFLTLYGFSVPSREDDQALYYGEVIMRNFRFAQNYSQRTLLNTIERLDSCGGTKRWFRDVSASNHIEINEDNQILLNGQFLIDNEAFVRIESALCTHCFGHSATLTDKQKKSCKGNLLTLLLHCFNWPYLHCVTPLYIFLRYKYLGKRFFEESIYDTDHNIFPLLKHNSTLFNSKNEEKDIQLMSFLYQAIGSQYPLLNYENSFSKHQSAEGSFSSYVFRKDLYRLLVKEDPDISLAISPFFPIPNWLKISNYLVEKVPDSSLPDKENLATYLNALYDLSLYENKFEESSIWAVLKSFEQISRPQNFFSHEMGFPLSVPCKTALRTIYNTLFKNSDSNISASPDEDADGFFETLKEQSFFQYADLNLCAFSRITKYAPSKTLHVYDPGLWQILPALEDFFSRQKAIIFRYFKFSLFPERPHKSSIKSVQLICHALFEKWSFDNTVTFCTKILPIARHNYHNECFYYEDLCDLLKKEDVDQLSAILGKESDLPPENRATLINHRSLFLFFIADIIYNEKKKKAASFNALIQFTNGDESDFNYCLHTILDFCCSLTIWDLQSRLWSTLYETADLLYPLRSNTSHRKIETNLQ